MIRKLYEFLGFCWHDWELIQKVNLFEEKYVKQGMIPTGRKWIFRCKKCNKIKNQIV